MVEIMYFSISFWGMSLCSNYYGWTLCNMIAQLKMFLPLLLGSCLNFMGGGGGGGVQSVSKYLMLNFYQAYFLKETNIKILSLQANSTLLTSPQTKF